MKIIIDSSDFLSSFSSSNIVHTYTHTHKRAHADTPQSKFYLFTLHKIFIYAVKISMKKFFTFCLSYLFFCFLLSLFPFLLFRMFQLNIQKSLRYFNFIFDLKEMLCITQFFNRLIYAFLYLPPYQTTNTNMIRKEGFLLIIFFFFEI